MKFANEIDLSVAMDAVFAFVADQRNIPLWNYYVVDVVTGERQRSCGWRPLSPDAKDRQSIIRQSPGWTPERA